MFSDDEIKEMSENSFIQPGDEIISIHEVCLSDKFEKRDLALLTNPGRYDLDITRSLYRDGFFPSEHQQARFAWTEEDDNIAELVSDPGFGAGHTNFGRELEAALKNMQFQEADTSTSSQYRESVFSDKYTEPQAVSSSSTSGAHLVNVDRSKRESAKVDKADPRSRFHFVKYLKRHGRTVKIWECGICSREFQHQYTLIRHVPTHTDERNFHCDACGKSFRQLSTLSQHRAIHSADRPYSCDVCRKTFNRVSTLISHRKTHSDNKPYRCHLCPKGFHQKGNLRNHLFTHTNERPYRCTICNKGFNQQSNLVCHKNKTHPDTVMREQTIASDTNAPPLVASPMKNEPETAVPPVNHCEVSSSVGPYPIEGPSTSNWTPKWDQRYPEPDIWALTGGLNGFSANGVIVEPIKTYNLGVALGRQTPFALLKPDNGVPVLVKVVETKLPGGKQMLVPATADDLRFGGKVVVNNDGMPNTQNLPQLTPSSSSGSGSSSSSSSMAPPRSVQLRAVGGGRGGETHTRLNTQVPLSVQVEGCIVKDEVPPDFSEDFPPESLIDSPPLISIPMIEHHRNDRHISSSCALPPPPPSPPLDLINMDLFEHMDCIPMGPQITAVGNIDQPPTSDDSDIFIGEFEESIALSDSD